MNNTKTDFLNKKWLVIIPVKKNLKESLRSKMSRCANSLKSFMGKSIDLVFDERGPGDENFSAAKIGVTARLQKLADIRNECIKEYVKPGSYDYVVMCDADVWYEKDILKRLYSSACKTGIDINNLIFAPGVYVEYLNKKFYDTSGFISLYGEKARYDFPYFRDGNNGIREMSSVGTFYMMPSWICDKVTYSGIPGPTDHYSVCKQAKTLGVRTFCDLTIVAHHANLPKYGESWH